MGWIVHGTPELDAKSSYRSVNGLVIAFAVLMVITTVLRLYVRRSRLAVDDAIVVLGASLSVVYNVLVVIQTKYGLGLPKQLRPKQDLPYFLLYNFAARPFQWVALTCFKVALCISYRRMMNRTTMNAYQIVVWVCATLLIIICIVGTCCNIFNCTPIRKSLDPTIPGHCIDYATYNYGTWGINVVLDFFVFLLPVPMFMRMSIDMKLKIELSLLFALSLLTTALGVWKLQQVTRIAYGDGNSTQFCVLNALEANLGMILSSIPHLRPLYQSGVRFITGRNKSSVARQSYGMDKIDSMAVKAYPINPNKSRGISGSHQAFGRTYSEDHILRPGDIPLEDFTRDSSDQEHGITKTSEITITHTNLDSPSTENSDRYHNREDKYRKS